MAGWCTSRCLSCYWLGQLADVLGQSAMSFSVDAWFVLASGWLAGSTGRRCYALAATFAT